MSEMSPREAMEIAVAMLLDMEEIRGSEFNMESRVELVKRFFARLTKWNRTSTHAQCAVIQCSTTNGADGFGAAPTATAQK